MGGESGLGASRQCGPVGLPRSTFYAPEPKPRAFTGEEGRAMAVMDARQPPRPPCGAGSHMRKPAGHRPKFPYLLKGRRVGFPSRAWPTDVTCIPPGRGHVCLSAIIDWHGRHIVGWRPRDAMEARGCVACMERAFAEHGTPAMADSDQGGTRTSDEYVACLERRGVARGMDGKGRWVDNVFIERWFRDLRHYRICQREHSGFGELRRLVAEHVDIYNNVKMHGSLDYATPASRYRFGMNSQDGGVKLAA